MTGVIQRRIRIVDGAWPTDHQQAVIAPLQNIGDDFAGAGDFIFIIDTERKLIFQFFRRDQDLFCTNMYIIEPVFLHDSIPVFCRFALKWNIERSRVLAYHEV